MKILYIGDVMADPGKLVLKQLLPQLKKDYQIDFVIAQAENSNPLGKGPGLNDIAEMQEAGVDAFTGGNHSLRGHNPIDVFDNPKIDIVRPANLQAQIGKGWTTIDTPFGKILLVSMLGQTVGSHQLEIDNPLTCVDAILRHTANHDYVARIINLHGDFSSEKRVFGYYLDGRFSMVVGDHWHVPTADAMIMPKGTAHITDVGMCGTLHSSIGVKTEVIIERWKTGQSSRNIIEEDGPLQFNALLADIDTKTGLAVSVEQIQRQINQ